VVSDQLTAKEHVMYLSAYHFDGDPTELTAAYKRMMSRFPVDDLLFHAFIVGESGVVVLDACPDKAAHERFAASPEFRAAQAEAGLPEPRIEVLGDVPCAYVQPSAVTLVGSPVTA
jgi:hypothetical protein